MRAPLFLRVKHWQVFVPMVAIPFAVMFLCVIIMAINIGVNPPEGPRGPGDVLWVFYFMPVVFLLSAGTQLLWIWNVAVNLRKYIQSPERKPRVKLFYFTFFLPIVYMCIMPFLMISFLKTISTGYTPDFSSVISFFITLFIGNLTMMFCFLNNNYVVTKTIKMAELQRKVTFSDFAGDFFFMLVFPIAIWFIQPRINKIVDGENKNSLFSEGSVQNDLLD